jgi:exosortase
MISKPPDRIAAQRSVDHTFAPDLHCHSGRMLSRSGLFALILLTSVLAFWPLFTSLARLSLENEHYSHLLFIPAITAGLIIWKKNRAFETGASCKAALLPIALLCVLEYLLTRIHGIAGDPNLAMFLAAAGIVALWGSAFVLCFGYRALKNARFAWSFLFLAVPLPAVTVNALVEGLQRGSAEVSFVLFKALGLPILREGFIFALPGVTIEIAKECSGIRSSTSLLIVSILAGHLFLRSNWRTLCLCVATVPVVILKNALRIVGISWLGVNLNRAFFDGKLHHQYGGMVFSAVSLLLQVGLLALLHASERSGNTRRPSGDPPGTGNVRSAATPPLSERVDTPAS